jgi:hypothetical protein
MGSTFGLHAMRRSTFLAVLLAGAATLVAGRVSAQPSGEQVAERLFNEAIALVSAGKYADACPKLEESQRLDPALGTEFNLADCYEHTGRKGSARRLFIEVADAAKAAGKAEREKTSRERASALEAVAPRLTIVVPPSSAEIRLEVTVDGAPFPAAKWSRAQPFDAGSHTVVASAPGKKPFDTKVALQDGKGVEVKIPELENEPAAIGPGPGSDESAREAGNGQRRTGIIVGGIGVVGLLVGGGAGLFSLVKHGAAKDICADYHQCPDAGGRSKWNAATDAGTVSTIAFVVGGMGVVAGGLLYFTASKNPTANPAAAGWWVTPSIGLGSAGLVAGGHL